MNNLLTLADRVDDVIRFARGLELAIAGIRAPEYRDPIAELAMRHVDGLVDLANMVAEIRSENGDKDP